MVKYTLVYFNGRARAEPIRFAFAVSGTPFEDKRLTQETWPKEKPNAPQGRLPYLCIDSKKVSQSMAILRYLGREFKLYGKDSMEMLYIDEIIDTCSDLMDCWAKAAFADSNKEECMKKFKSESVPKFYDMLEKCVKGCGKKGFAVGEKISIADLTLFNTVESCGCDCLDKYPSLKANRATVEKDANLCKYLKSRPKTDF